MGCPLPVPVVIIAAAAQLVVLVALIPVMALPSFEYRVYIFQMLMWKKVSFDGNLWVVMMTMEGEVAVATGHSNGIENIKKGVKVFHRTLVVTLLAVLLLLFVYGICNHYLFSVCGEVTFISNVQSRNGQDGGSQSAKWNALIFISKDK